jgi:hypothetical protein
MDWSLVQRSPAECGVSECDLETSKRRRPRPDLEYCATGKKEKMILFYKYMWKGIIQYNMLLFTLRSSSFYTLDNKNRNSFPPVKLIFPKLVKKFPTCFVIQWFITVFLRSRYLSLSWAILIQYITFYFSQMHLRYPPSHLRVSLTSFLFPRGFPTNISCAFLCRYNYY